MVELHLRDGALREDGPGQLLLALTAKWLRAKNHRPYRLCVFNVPRHSIPHLQCPRKSHTEKMVARGSVLSLSLPWLLRLTSLCLSDGPPETLNPKPSTLNPKPLQVQIIHSGVDVSERLLEPCADSSFG